MRRVRLPTLLPTYVAHHPPEVLCFALRSEVRITNWVFAAYYIFYATLLPCSIHALNVHNYTPVI